MFGDRRMRTLGGLAVIGTLAVLVVVVGRFIARTPEAGQPAPSPTEQARILATPSAPVDVTARPDEPTPAQLARSGSPAVSVSEPVTAVLPSAPLAATPTPPTRVTSTPSTPGARPFRRLRMVTITTGWAVRVRPGVAEASLWRTTDAGMRWTDVTPSGNESIRAEALVDGTTAWLAAPHVDGTIAIDRSVNGGVAGTSTLLHAPAITPGFPSLPIGLDFIDAQHGWLEISGGSMHAPISALFQASDGGQTWTRLNPSDGDTYGALAGLRGFETTTTGWATGEVTGGALAAVATPSVMTPGRLFVPRDNGRTWRY
jgi:hypothetical protein